MIHRQNNVLLTDSDGDPDFAASYTVIALSVGAVASANSSGTTATVDSGHGFKANDKMLIYDGTTATFVAEGINSVTGTTIVWSSATPSITSGDLLVNLGPDTASGSTPAFDASLMTIYSDSDGGASISNSLVTTDSSGNYNYYTNGDGRSWELIRDASGTVAGVIQGWSGVSGRFNVADFGGNFQVVIDAAKAFTGAGLSRSTTVIDTGSIVDYSGAGFIIPEQVSLQLAGIDYEITSTVSQANAVITVTAGIIIDQGAHLIGLKQGSNTGTVIKRGNNLNADLIATETVGTGTGGSAAFWHWGMVESLTLEGNAANNTTGSGLRVENPGEVSVIRAVQSQNFSDFGSSVGDGIEIIGALANGSTVENLTLNNNRYGLNVSSASSVLVVKGLSGDNNTSLLRIDGTTSLSVVVIGVKAESTVAGRHDPLILLEGTVSNDPQLTIIGGLVNPVNSKTNLINIQTTNWNVTIQNLYVEQYTNAINDILNSTTQPLAELSKTNLFIYTNGAPWYISRGAPRFANNIKLIWKNLGGTEVDILQGASNNYTRLAALATGIQFTSANFAAIWAALTATQFNLSVPLTGDITTFTGADATPSVTGGNVFKTSGTTAITDFDNGIVGQTIRILATASITITDNAAIILSGSANYDMTDTDTLVLTMYNDQIWQEDSRSVN